MVDVGKNGIPNDPTASDLVRFRNLNAFIRGFPQLRDLEVTIIQPLREKFSLLFRKWIINSFSRELRVLPQLKRYNFKIGSTTTYGSKTPLLTCLEDVLAYTRRDTQWILTNYMQRIRSTQALLHEAIILGWHAAYRREIQNKLVDPAFRTPSNKLQRSSLYKVIRIIPQFDAKGIMVAPTEIVEQFDEECPGLQGSNICRCLDW